MPEIQLQPKQSQMLDMVESHQAVVIGIGGGRGAAKSSGADRVAITLMYEHQGLAVCMVMRTWVKQMVPFHLEPIRRDFPWLADSLTASPPAILRIGRSRMEFKYAENYDAVEEAFRSGNYDLIMIDQAEQFTAREIREIRKAARSKGKWRAKVVLLFNMRGANIQELRKWFYTKEYNKDEDANDYAFLKVNPWDNIEWVRPALELDGYSEFDYYAWTDEQRKSYAAIRGEYTRQLATDDEIIRASDWEGGWDSLEGAYFANSFDLEETRKHPAVIESLKKPWANLWISQDFGKSHWCSTHWHFRVTLSPTEVEKYLGWIGRKSPLNVICTYREMIVSELTSTEVARKIIESTPQLERERIRAYFLSPECVTDDPNSIGHQQAKELRSVGMRGPSKADNDRIGGAQLMAKLLKATKQRGVDPEGVEYADCLLISSECVEWLNAIPMLLRDPKNLDDVMKTDKGAAKLEMDLYDDCRYGYKSMLAPRQKTEDDIFKEKMDQAQPAQRMVLAFRQQQKKIQKSTKYTQPSWKGNL
jgi:hypothetical protein